MVAKILPPALRVATLVYYNERKVEQGQARLLLASGFGVEIERLNTLAKIGRFAKLTDLNTRSKLNAVHVVLAFDPSEKPPVEVLQKLSMDYMEGIGFGDQPFLVYQHFDAAHPHLHVVTTPIQADGKRISLHNLGRDKSEPLRVELEQRYGLVKAKGMDRSRPFAVLPLDIELARYGERPLKRSIANVVGSVLRDYRFESLGGFNAVLRRFGVMAEPGAEGSKMEAHQGLVYSLVDGDGKRVGLPIKASSLGGRPTLARLEARFVGSKVHLQKLRPLVREKVDRVLARGKALDRSVFAEELAKLGLDLVVRHAADGRVFGVTFVDHGLKCAVNGSSLGKGYSAAGLKHVLGVLPSKELGVVQDAQVGIGLGDSGRSSGLVFGNPLEVLLEKADYHEPPLMARRRRKKGKGKSKGRGL